MTANIGDYHYFTTKIGGYVRAILGVKNMRVVVLVYISILLILLAYVASISTWDTPYYTKIYLYMVPQTLVIVAVFTLLLAISLYEFRAREKYSLKLLLFIEAFYSKYSLPPSQLLYRS